MIACAQCRREFDPGSGRGRKSRYCETCRASRANIRALKLQFQVFSATVLEVAQMMGSTLARMRLEVNEKQDRRCHQCDRKGRLFLSETGDELVGLCIDCFTRSNQHGDDEKGQGDSRVDQRAE